MSDRDHRPLRDQDPTLRARKQSISPTRSRGVAVQFRDRSRDRSVDRSSIISNGNQQRHQSSPIKPLEVNGKDVKDGHLKTEDERGRSSSRKADEEAGEAKNDQDMMMQLMGFGAFDSTKGKHVAGVGSGTAKKNKKAQFRQYMNREKGFNRNLSPERTRRK